MVSNSHRYSVLALSSPYTFMLACVDCDNALDCASSFEKTLAAPNLEDDGHSNLFGLKIRFLVGMVIGFHVSPCPGMWELWATGWIHNRIKMIITFHPQPYRHARPSQMSPSTISITFNFIPLSPFTYPCWYPFFHYHHMLTSPSHIPIILNPFNRSTSLRILLVAHLVSHLLLHPAYHPSLQLTSPSPRSTTSTPSPSPVLCRLPTPTSTIFAAAAAPQVPMHTWRRHPSCFLNWQHLLLRQQCHLWRRGHPALRPSLASPDSFTAWRHGVRRDAVLGLVPARASATCTDHDSPCRARSSAIDVALSYDERFVAPSSPSSPSAAFMSGTPRAPLASRRLRVISRPVGGSDQLWGVLPRQRSRCWEGVHVGPAHEDLELGFESRH